MLIYLIVIGGLSSLLIFFLVPLRLVIDLEYTGTNNPPNAQGDLHFFAGLFGLRLRHAANQSQILPLICGWTVPIQRQQPRPAKPQSPSRSDKSNKKRKPSTRSPQSSSKTGLSYDRLVFWLQIVGPAAWDLAKKIPHIFHLKHMDLSGSFGFIDPVKTGFTYGYFQALHPLVDHRLNLNINPDFTTARIQGRLNLAIHLYLGYFVYILCRFAIHAGFRWLKTSGLKRRTAPTTSSRSKGA